MAQTMHNNLGHVPDFRPWAKPKPISNLPPFKRYVEIGRVALVNYGKEYGRLVVIVDVIDQNRVLSLSLSLLISYYPVFGCNRSSGLGWSILGLVENKLKLSPEHPIVQLGRELGTNHIRPAEAMETNITSALVDAPDMVRCQMNFKRLSLTDITIEIKRVPNKKTLVAAMEAADVKNKWENSSWGRKLIVQKRRAALNDFDRFKLMLAKIKRGGLVRKELAKLKKQNAA
ncbi:hypothetical protein C3L33_15084, partial [Rhododendron williamsianum]